MPHILVSTYHNAPFNGPTRENSHGNPWCHLFWDRYTAEGYLEAAGIIRTGSSDDTKADELLDKAFATILERATHEPNNFVFIGDLEVARNGSMYALIIPDAETAQRYLTPWIESIKEDEYWASGDDSHFDYAPDELELIYQIARHFDLRPLYEDFVSWAVTRWFHHDPDDPPIQKWEA